MTSRKRCVISDLTPMLRDLQEKVIHPIYDGFMSITTAVAIDPAEESFARVVQRVRAEFLEMPGLTLTVPQAARLWSLDTTVCAAVLETLEQARCLVRTRTSAFSRAD